MSPVLSIMDRFWRHVSKTETCWLWTGASNHHGYGKINADTKGRRHFRAHRLSWEHHYGPIPKGLGVLHRCDTPACVRPDHLLLGDQKANLRDAAAKGRTEHGERHHAAKLTDHAVRDIRARVLAGERRVVIARDYGISYWTVGLIVRRVRWAHLA